MAVYKGESPLQLSGDPQKDVVTLRNALYERDMQLRYVLEHLDGENLADDFLDTVTAQPVIQEAEEVVIDMTEAEGILAVENGGTGAATVTAALQSLGIMATVGEVLDLNRTLLYHGFLSNSQKTVTIDVPLPKILPSGATVTIDSLKINMRKPAGGYIGSAASYVSGGEEYVGNANYTVSLNSIMPHRIAIALTNSASTFNSTNNVPISIEGTVKLTVKG